jgi:DNA-binding CsgD family transcriptional regulator
MSPRTVNKHLEHIFEKLGVETRTAAAAIANSLLLED